MEVYKLTDEQAAAWTGKYGIYEFKPIRDANDNWIAGLENTNNNYFPFTTELKKCIKITYNPIKVTV